MDEADPMVWCYADRCKPLERARSSQPTLSRLLNLLVTDINVSAFRDGLLDTAVWWLSSVYNGTQEGMYFVGSACYLNIRQAMTSAWNARTCCRTLWLAKAV